jgi:SAM-dependent methyltransferase
MVAFALSLTVTLAIVPVPLAARQQTGQPAAADATAFEPEVGQAGKDVVWVPTSPELVQKMLDMAKVTPQDFVVDLGSGDGRNVIAAAKRGATGVGFEYNPDMVSLSRRLAREAGVADKATFVEGDMFEADFSKATVLALFLLTDNLDRLKDKFLQLRPGTRIVLNTFGVTGWEADETERLDECSTWCTSMLYIVPAPVDGTWKTPQGEIVLSQEFQKISGALTSGGTRTDITEGRLRGDQITFTAGGRTYSGRITGNRMEITPSGGGALTATRAGS